jgi:hypothetical protein
MESLKMFALLMSAILVLAGCANFTNSAFVKEMSPEELSGLVTDSTRRVILVFPGVNGGHPRVCAEPPPDVVFEYANRALAEGKFREIAGGKLESESSATIENVTHPEKLRAILIFREAMYRLCEASINHDLTPEQMERAAASVLKVVARIAEAEILATEVLLLREVNKSEEARKVHESLKRQPDNTPEKK